MKIKNYNQKIKKISVKLRAVILILLIFNLPFRPLSANENDGAEIKNLILSGGPNPTDNFCVDDDIYVYLNGNLIYSDIDPNDAGCNNPPVVFEANFGDELKVIAIDSVGFCRSIGPLWLHKDSQSVKLDSGINDGCEGWPPGVTFYDKAFIISHEIIKEVPEWRKNIQPGDILYDDEALGGFGHIGIYVGNVEIGEKIFYNQVAEANKKTDDGKKGVQYRDIETWDYPKRKLVYLIRVNVLNNEIKGNAVAFMKEQINKPYEFPWTTKNPDPNSPEWYCSELVWAAYYNQGIDLETPPDPLGGPVAPFEIYADNDVFVMGSHIEGLAEKGKKSLIFRIFSPVNVEITDPDGNIISKVIDDIDDAVYIVDDLDGDGHYEDIIAISERKTGEYKIKITPKPGALPQETYTLKVTAGAAEIILADNLPISGIPEKGQIFTFNSDTDAPADKNAVQGFSNKETSKNNVYAAGTLDFSLSADEWQPEDKAVNLLPDDFITRNVGVVNSGNLGFQYKVRAQISTGNDDFCGALYLEAKLDGNPVYSGGLTSFISDNFIFSSSTDNWNFEVGLPVSSLEFEDKSCEFKFVFEGGQDNLPIGEGFFDVEKLENVIEAGSSETGNFSPIADSYISKTKPDTNYGDKQNLFIKSHENQNKNAFIRFYFNFPSGTEILSSNLKLFMKKAPSENRIYEASMVWENWNEKNPDGVTWDNQPSASPSPTDLAESGSEDNVWLNWDVIDDVTDFAAGKYPNYGWRLSDSEDFASPSQEAKFYSRENSHIPLRPVLEISFLSPAATTTYPVINEVYYQVGSDKGSDPKNEWLEIYNPTDGAIDISGWKICDGSDCDTIPSSSPIPAKGFAVVAADNSTWEKWPDVPEGAIKINLNSYLGGGLTNFGDRIILKDNNDNIIDTISYGSDTSQLNPSIPLSGEGKSLTRIVKGYDTDSAFDWMINVAPNPGLNPSENGAEEIRFGSEGIEMAVSEKNLTPLPSGEELKDESEEPVEELEELEDPQESINNNEAQTIKPVEIIKKEPTIINGSNDQNTTSPEAIMTDVASPETQPEKIIEEKITEDETAAESSALPPQEIILKKEEDIIISEN